MTKILSIMLTVFTGAMFYFTINVATIFAWIGLAATALYLILEMVSTLDTDCKYVWYQNKEWAVIKGCAFVIFVMSVCIFASKQLV